MLLSRGALGPAAPARCRAARRALVARPVAFLAGEPAPEADPPAPSAPAASAKRGRRPATVSAPRKEPKSVVVSPRAPTAFNLFHKQRFPAYKAANPGVKLVDSNKALRAEWDALPEAAKANFIEEAASRKAKVDAIKAEALALKKANAKPLTAYMIFSNRQRDTIKAENPEAKFTQIASLLGEAWNKLPEEQRAVYKEQAASEMAAWKTKQGAASA